MAEVVTVPDSSGKIDQIVQNVLSQIVPEKISMQTDEYSQALAASVSREPVSGESYQYPALTLQFESAADKKAFQKAVVQPLQRNASLVFTATADGYIMEGGVRGASGLKDEALVQDFIADLKSTFANISTDKILQ